VICLIDAVPSLQSYYMQNIENTFVFIKDIKIKFIIYLPGSKVKL